MAIATIPPSIDKFEKASQDLAGALMGQMVNAMLKTLELDHKQDMFLSFMAEEIGSKIAQSGITDTLTHCIKEKLTQSQSEGTANLPPNPTTIIQAYGGMSHAL